MERFPLAEADVEGPLNGAKDEGPAESADKVVKVEFQSRSQLSKVLQSHRGEQLVITTSDVMEMMADLKRTSRVAVLQGALSSWFACATGLSVLEVDCNEQRQPMEGDVGSHVVFRIRLNAVYEVEVAKVPKVEDLCAMYRQKLIQVLPKELVETKGDKLKQMIQVSWVQPGSVILGGVAALSLLAIIGSAFGLSKCYCDCCLCLSLCSCMRRGAGNNDLYFCTMKELEQRGCTLDVQPDGSATLQVPPAQRSSTCFTM